MNRREFIEQTKAGTIGIGLGLTVLASAKSAYGAPANEKITLGFVGTGGRGRNLLGDFLLRDDIHVGYLCDPRQERLDSAVKISAEGQPETPKTSRDFRDVIGDESIDALINATPDHWHALVCIEACKAMKDVYTEKPASHNAWEGQKMVDAARKYDRVVQLGTQSRSAPYTMDAKQFIEEGGLGDIHLCRVYNQKFQDNFDLGQPTAAPESVSWDLWNGPAPEKPFRPGYLSHWHHLWDYSSGDMINDGVHQLDLARWLIGKELPKSAYCTGGRFDTTGDAESPDTQLATFTYDDLVMTFEQTLYTPYMLKTDMELRQSDMIPYWPQNATRIEIFGSEAMMFMGRHGGGYEVYARPQSREPVCTRRVYGRFPDPEHKENFLHCMRDRIRPNADIEKGHRSTLHCHYATISYRLGGKVLNINTEDGTLIDCPEGEKFYRREYRTPYVIEEV